MAISPKLLADGEYVVLSTRTHIKELFAPIVVLILVGGVSGFLLGVIPDDPSWLYWVIVGLAALAALAWVVWPFLNWLSSTYTVTNRRLITRRGVITRHGHDLPLRRINDVSYEKQLTDRMLGCGTLVISTASEEGQIELPDVPHVEHVHLQITELLFGGGATGDLATGPDEGTGLP
ncbi:MAG: PH domain-containing protein [Propionibacteriales bacterium]|nr:PH domain-containing protein [Propionibacteriales bacterium]